ncbi:MAG: heavy-metal-associated domain-containing protein [Candidatus Obscuribacterales bacterium]|nr:heavy-metal-associated domain-containing protein [Candidatus Obscuribacterales bacterium]
MLVRRGLRLKSLSLIYLTITFLLVTARNPLPAKEKEAVERLFVARIQGSFCPSCLSSLEKALQSHKGVSKVEIDRRQIKKSKYALVEIIYRSDDTSKKKLKRIIEFEDFEVVRVSDRRQDKK